MTKLPHRPIVAAFAFAAALAVPLTASAHCDTLDGPVVSAARLALQQGKIQPVLKWVKADGEAELRTAFAQTLKVRAAGGESRELADRYFFETLVRLHRAGEGAPYTGLKPAGSVEEPIAAADEAIVKGSADQLGAMLSNHLAAGIRERFARVSEAKAHAEDSPEAGRRYVAAYVEYVHFVEAVVQTVHGAGHAHGSAAAPGHEK